MKYDLIVIGSGAAASTIAYECNSKGLKTALIDEKEFGGTCALRGCDPKKVLVGAAEIIDWSNRMNHVLDGSIKIRWEELMKFKNSFTEPFPRRFEEGLIGAGIDVFHGKARFKNVNTINVDEELEAKYIAIATGARPSKLRIKGEEYIINSEQFLRLDAIPDDITFIGGGYISFEFAHIAARVGANVTILHRGKKPLERFDEELVALLIEKSKSIGIDVYTNSEVKSIEKSKNGYRVNSNNKNIDTKLVVHGAGRVPNIDLDLDKGGVAYNRGIHVNDYLQSVSNPNVYAAGDVVDSNPYPLTPIAGYHGRIVAHNIINGNELRADYKGVPTVVFTIPPLASVGFREEELKKSNINKGDMSSWYSSRRINEKHAMFKVLIDDDNHILGAHILAHHAEEIINIFAMAIRLNLRIDDIKNMVFTYPTSTYDIKYMI